ncbi:MAG: spore coat protein CotJB [Oscillospiraceae bacterium]|nr:spore coat protein CotJB [Oscillospiraceae bacterium]
MAECDHTADNCGYKSGALPRCAPLATAYVPPQKDGEPRYAADKALARGTLFPGLDLPLGNIVNRDTADVPAAELMAVDFAAHDLSLYLDTHPEDEEAFAVYRDLLTLAEEGKKRYVARYGPICKADLVNASSYCWTRSPWPWELTAESEA